MANTTQLPIKKQSGFSTPDWDRKAGLPPCRQPRGLAKTSVRNNEAAFGKRTMVPPAPSPSAGFGDVLQRAHQDGATTWSPAPDVGSASQVWLKCPR